ncbi:MAG TPA: hypothetical protein PLL88_06700 [Anaerolineaceae bacterium]|nr:hypothetical protein [Anaerolineaceae bacterium]
MTAYANWEFYSTTYLGTAIAQAAFPALALRASAKIDQITFDRAAAIYEAAEDTETITKIKLATCAVADEMQRQISQPREVASERVGNFSQNYIVTKDMELTSDQRLANAAKLHLGSTGLMFAGFAAGEYGGAANAN